MIPPLSHVSGNSLSAVLANFSIGSVFWTGNAVATVITTQNTWTRVAPVAGTLATPTVNFDRPANARLRYTLIAAGNLIIAATYSISSAAPNDVYLIGIWKNGTVNANNEFTGGAQVAGSTVRLKAGGAGDVQSSSVVCVDVAALNDFYELAVQNTLSTADPTFSDANLFGSGRSA